MRDGAAKGKVERFFRTVREQFLSRSLDLSSLEALNRQFTHWVEEHYNAQKHSILQMTPLERFALDRARLRYLPPNQANDELFFVEEDRHVRADNTFSFKNTRYEAPRHLPDRTIQIRFQRKSPRQPGCRLLQRRAHGRARPLDPVANDGGLCLKLARQPSTPNPVEVGTRVSPRPPHISRRAVFPHRALQINSLSHSPSKPTRGVETPASVGRNSVPFGKAYPHSFP